MSGIGPVMPGSFQRPRANVCRPVARRRHMTDSSPAPIRHPQNLDRNLALELVRVTEAAAMAAGRWVGRGDKEGGDGAAVDAMRKLINSVPMRGIVVIGEGEKDNAPMLFNGEEVGDGTGPLVDVAVDPVDGTTLMSKGMPNAHRGARGRRARRDVRSERRVLHGEAGRRPGLRRRDRHQRRRRREPAPDRQGQEDLRSPTSRCASWTGRATPTLVEEVREAGARIRFISRRRHRRRDLRPPATATTSTC